MQLSGGGNGGDITRNSGRHGSENSSPKRPTHHYSVDCTHANTGLFVGIFVMVITIISLIVFFVLISSKDPGLHSAAITVASLTELVLYCIATVAVLVGMCQVKKDARFNESFHILASWHFEVLCWW